MIIFCARCLTLRDVGVWNAVEASTIYRGMALCQSHLDEQVQQAYNADIQAKMKPSPD